jgi:ribose 5-phosphate isomerase B
MINRCKGADISIAIGADHRGFLYKRALMQHTHLVDTMISLSWHDVGAFNDERSDYPLFAHAAMELMGQSVVNCAVLICGTGIGMAIAANRMPYIYAGVAWSEDVARRAREDDNVNVLVIPADYITIDVMFACVTVWLTASFRGERYAQRLQQIDE